MSRSGSHISTKRSQRASAAEPHPSVTAHAGSMRTPPNTASSFKAALKHPVDCLEADIRFTPDSEAYLSHDPLPMPLPRSAMRLKDLLNLTAAHPRVRLNLDMKEYTGIGEMAALIRRSKMTSLVILTGVGRGAVHWVKSSSDGLPYLFSARTNAWQRLTAVGAAGLARAIKACGARGLNSHHLFVTRTLARALARAGLSLSVWTVDGEREMRRMLDLGVDNITTNRIDTLLALRDGRTR